MKTALVTGAAGFIGCHLVRSLLADGCNVLSVDALKYSGRKESLGDCLVDPNHSFVELDITEEDMMRDVVLDFSPDWIFHLAAETHVDRSISGPMNFLKTNVFGTGSVVQAALDHWRRMDADRAKRFRFVHGSTDEVFGALQDGESAFREDSRYCPSSPYSASKAASDHVVRAWANTYGLPVIVTNCSNNYGPYQFPEKLIPMVVRRALRGLDIPVYGQGMQSRDWVHVEDYCAALRLIADTGIIGRTYLIGGGNEWRNIDLVEVLCDLVGEETGRNDVRELIEFVADRPGHDFRYAVDAAKINEELGWKPRRDFMEGLRETVRWYIENEDYWPGLD